MCIRVYLWFCEVEGGNGRFLPSISPRHHNQLRRGVGEEAVAGVGDDNEVFDVVAFAAHGVGEEGFDVEHHAGLDEGGFAGVDEGVFVEADAHAVADVGHTKRDVLLGVAGGANVVKVDDGDAGANGRYGFHLGVVELAVIVGLLGGGGGNNGRSCHVG